LPCFYGLSDSCSTMAACAAVAQELSNTTPNCAYLNRHCLNLLLFVVLVVAVVVNDVSPLATGMLRGQWGRRRRRSDAGYLNLKALKHVKRCRGRNLTAQFTCSATSWLYLCCCCCLLLVLDGILFSLSGVPRYWNLSPVSTARCCSMCMCSASLLYSDVNLSSSSSMRLMSAAVG
jgi:hypothetical protein